MSPSVEVCLSGTRQRVREDWEMLQRLEASVERAQAAIRAASALLDRPPPAINTSSGLQDNPPPKDDDYEKKLRIAAQVVEHLKAAGYGVELYDTRYGTGPNSRDN